MKTLSRDEARRTYDRIGRRQDSQAFYEDSAIDLIVRHGEFGTARRVFEFGCGTGRLAERLFSEQLDESAQYRAIDISPTMVALSKGRLAKYAPRASVELSDGGPPVGEPTGAYDRFVSTYVLDLLSEDDIILVLREAHRILDARGLLCLCGLSTGTGLASRSLVGIWSAIHRLRPALVGGCRPLELETSLSPAEWRIRFHQRVAPFAVPSEVLIAERIQAEPFRGSGAEPPGA